MGDSSFTGVVDPNCRAFGAENLYLATSGALPWASDANPTFTIDALARRLAAHIGSEFRALAQATSPTANAVPPT